MPSGDSAIPRHDAGAEGVGSTQPPAAAVVSARPGRTLLPRPLAQAVSFATRSTCLAIRAGSTVSSYGFDVAKIASLSSLELSRAVVESLLSRTGRHVLGRSKTDLSREEAESILESSLATVHQTISRALFWTTAGFELTGSTISLASDLSQLVLSSLDQFFGSTDSSRAIAAIIILIRREFQNPATGAEGEKVGVIDLIIGLSALSLLQHHCRKATEAEDRESEEVVWDVVVLNDGKRADVHTDGLINFAGPDSGANAPAHVDPELMRSIEEHGTLEESDDDDHPELRLKEQIMQSLPADTSVSISTSVAMTKTITVDINGSEIPLLSPPPGVEVIEQQQITDPAASREPSSRASPQRPSYRVVYRVDRNKLRSTELRHCGDSEFDSSTLRRLGEAEEVKDTPRSPSPPRDFKFPAPEPSSRRRSGSPHPGPAALLRGRLDMTSKPLPPNPTKSKPHHSRSKTSPSGQSHGGKSRPSTGANQKRPRMPLRSESQDGANRAGRNRGVLQTNPSPKKTKDEPKTSGQRPNEKKPGLKQALKRGPGHAISSLWGKDTPSDQPVNKSKLTGPTSVLTHSRGPSTSHLRDGSQTSPSLGRESRVSLDIDYAPTLRRTPSHSSYISVHERCRDSIVSTTDTFSIQSTDDRPPSPVAVRSEPRSRRNSGGAGQDADAYETDFAPRRALSRRPTASSMYSLASNDSQNSLVLSSYYQRSAYSDTEALRNLRRTGMVEGTFPRFHILRNITRYVRFSTASYGSSFMKYMGISKEMPILKALDNTHHDIRSFVRHTKSTQESILLASFVDPQGGSDSTGSTNTGVPLVHYISLDHESKAVVLACRGTLGFEDVLADMTCDYDDLLWRGRSYKVHKGIHASARRLLYGADGKVIQTIKMALDEFEDYGLVLCGHSLGGGVTALLGIMLSEPFGTSFVTSSEPHLQFLANSDASEKDTHVCLPPGRPIHVYAYGPPGTMSSSLRKAARGLVTTVVQGNDLVPYLSLGVLHDLQAVALAFKNDSGAAKAEIRGRVWERFQNGLADRWYNRGSAFVKSRDSEWAVSLLKNLRGTMVYDKLLPPGEVFVVESTRVLRRDAFVERVDEHIGRPARRAVLKYVKDVEGRFGEARFGTSMLMDHSPASYEDALNTLRMGVSGSDFGK